MSNESIAIHYVFLVFCKHASVISEYSGLFLCCFVSQPLLDAATLKHVLHGPHTRYAPLLSDSMPATAASSTVTGQRKLFGFVAKSYPCLSAAGCSNRLASPDVTMCPDCAATTSLPASIAVAATRLGSCERALSQILAARLRAQRSASCVQPVLLTNFQFALAKAQADLEHAQAAYSRFEDLRVCFHGNGPECLSCEALQRHAQPARVSTSSHAS